MRAARLRRRLQRYRPWWPLWLAGAAGVLAVLITAALPPSDDKGIAGPLILACVITGLAGLVSGLIVGIVHPSAPIELRIGMALVVLALVTALTLRVSPLVAGLAAVTGSVVSLASAWCGRRIMSALLPQVDDDH